MGSRDVLASSLMACLLAVVFFGVTPAASADAGEKSVRKPGKGKNFVIDIKRPVRGPRIHLPIGPAYVYYDYPYYYSRGYYPRHIGGYVYYPYHYYRRYY
jgi:hypothetical protein